LIHGCAVRQNGLQHCFPVQIKVVITGLDPVIHAGTDPAGRRVRGWPDQVRP
jgi:hypothetical protein